MSRRIGRLSGAAVCCVLGVYIFLIISVKGILEGCYKWVYNAGDTL